MAKPKTVKMGRPPKPPGEVKAKPIQVRLTTEEHEIISKVAENQHRSVSNLIYALVRDIIDKQRDGQG